MTRICTLTNDIILIEIILLHVRKTNKKVTFLKLRWLRDLTLHGNKMYNIINGYAVTIHSCYKFYIEAAKKAKIGVADQRTKKQIDLFDLILFATADLCLSVPSFPL